MNIFRSVDSSIITSFCVHECEGSTRMGSRPRRFIFTGHSNGAIQMWDLSTALEFFHKNLSTCGEGGPTPQVCPLSTSTSHEFFQQRPLYQELIRQLEQCELTSSRCSTPCLSPSPSLTVSQMRLKERNLAFINHNSDNNEN